MTNPDQTPSPLPTVSADPASRVRALGAALRGAFVERDTEIACILTALVAQEHVLLLGDPGTGKSALTSAVCKAIGGGFFQVLMTPFTVPEEVFGPTSLLGLEQDQYRRVTTGYLPEAKVAFLDEIFKANSAILNSMLTALNERAFDNGGVRSQIPLELTIGASNELPESSALDALYDRFLFRRWVESIKDRDALRGLLAARSEPSVGVTLSSADLAAVRAAAAQVVLPDPVLDAMLDMKDELARANGITCSDRRWRKMAKLVRAQAAIAGRSTATKDDLLILVDAIWRKPEERAAVHATVARVVAPQLAEALKVLDAAVELFSGAKSVITAASDVAALAKVNRELKSMLTEISKLDQSGPVVECTEKVQAMNREVAKIIQRLIGG